MYTRAHEVMSLAIAALICATLVQSLLLGILLMPCAFAIGHFPDLDFKLPTQHRGKASHSPLGIFAITVIILGVALFYLLVLIDGIVSLFGTTIIGGFPTFFPKLFSGDFFGAFTDPFFIILLTFYGAFLMHLLLDTITRRGLKWAGHNVKGDYRSADLRINQAFIWFGIISTLLSIPFFLIRILSPFPIYPYYAYVIISFLVSIILIFSGSIYLRKRHAADRCLEINNHLICLQKKCVLIDGKTYCPPPSQNMSDDANF